MTKDLLEELKNHYKQTKGIVDHYEMACHFYSLGIEDAVEMTVEWIMANIGKFDWIHGDSNGITEYEKSLREFITNHE